MVERPAVRKRLVIGSILLLFLGLLAAYNAREVDGREELLPGSLRLVDMTGNSVALDQVVTKRSVIAFMDVECGRCVELAILLGVMRKAVRDSGCSMVSVFFNDPETLRAVSNNYKLAGRQTFAAERPQHGTLARGAPHLFMLEHGAVARHLGPGLTMQQYADRILRFLQDGHDRAENPGRGQGERGI
jgi:hypothetical protein